MNPKSTRQQIEELEQEIQQLQKTASPSLQVDLQRLQNELRQLRKVRELRPRRSRMPIVEPVPPPQVELTEQERQVFQSFARLHKALLQYSGWVNRDQWLQMADVAADMTGGEPGGAEMGVTDGSEAGPGRVGEYLEGWGQVTSTTILADPQPSDYSQVGTPLTLTAGDWMVGGQIEFEEVGAPTSLVSGLIADVTDPNNGTWSVIRGVSGQDLSLNFSPARYNITAPLTIAAYLAVVTGWSPAPTTFPVNWWIWARRMR